MLHIFSINVLLLFYYIGHFTDDYWMCMASVKIRSRDRRFSYRVGFDIYGRTDSTSRII